MKRKQIVRDALRRGQGSAEPDLTRLVSAVPELMAEAARRRAVDAMPDPAGLLAARAWRAIPKLAAATAAALVLAVLASLVSERGERASSGDDATGLESLILTGGEDEIHDDVLLDAVLAEDDGRG